MRLADTPTKCLECGKIKKRVSLDGVCQHCRTRKRQGPCVQCGSVGWIRARGMCTTCYGQTIAVECSNCGNRRQRRQSGLCQACHIYLERTGFPRPIDPEVRKELHGFRIALHAKIKAATKKTEYCRRCHEEPIFNKKSGLCTLCYFYKHRTGRPRPKHLFIRKCTRCEAPIGQGIPSGLCIRCYRYQYVYDGRPRPESAWKTVTPWLGWCECGTRNKPVPATHVVDIQLGTAMSVKEDWLRFRNDQIILCDKCFAEHERMLRDGGYFDHEGHSAVRRGE